MAKLKFPPLFPEIPEYFIKIPRPLIRNINIQLFAPHFFLNSQSFRHPNFARSTSKLRYLPLSTTASLPLLTKFFAPPGRRRFAPKPPARERNNRNWRLYYSGAAKFARKVADAPGGGPVGPGFSAATASCGGE